MTKSFCDFCGIELTGRFPARQCKCVLDIDLDYFSKSLVGYLTLCAECRGKLSIEVEKLKDYIVNKSKK